MQTGKIALRGRSDSGRRLEARVQPAIGKSVDGAKCTEKSFLFWLIVVVLTLDMLVAGSVWQGLTVLRKRSVSYAEQDTRNIASAVDASLTYSIERVDGSLRTLVNEIQVELAQGKLQHSRLSRMLDEQRLINHSSKAWAIFDAEGTPILVGEEKSTFTKVADCDYFIRAKYAHSDALIMSAPVTGQQANTYRVIFARAFRYPDGRFGGIVSIPLTRQFFSKSIGSLSVRRQELIAVLTNGLSLIAVHGNPLAISIAGKSVSSDMPKALIERLLAKETSGSGWLEQSGWGNSEIYSFRHLACAPLLVLAGVASGDYLGEWYRTRHVAIVYLFLFWSLSILIAYILYRSWRRQCCYAEELKQANERLVAGNGAMAALLKVGEQGLFSVDCVTQRWDCSPEQLSIFGIDEDYPRTLDKWFKLIHPEDKKQCQDYLRRLLEQKTISIDMECRVVRPRDAEIRWIHVIGKIEYFADGLPERVLGAIRDITALRESQKRIKHLALHDELTGLPNRVLLSSKIQAALAQALRKKESLAICFHDIDGFKSVNDKYGHEVGNAALVEIALRLKAFTRTEDTVARLGGDEFVILLGGIRDDTELKGTLQRLQLAVQRPIQIGEFWLSLTSSMGVTLFPRDSAMEADVLIRHADNAMYEAKRRGKNGIHIFDPDSDRSMRERLDQLARIMDAYREQEFVLYYQPKVDLSNGRVIGVEALIRWLDPQRGVLSPSSFLPFIEHTDFAIELGEWVIREAMQQKRMWQAEGIDVAVSVNVFSLHLQQKNFVSRLAEILSEFPDVDPHGLELEILETSLIKDLQEVSHRILDSVALGVSFSIDDFGTGYSSLSYFRRFPVDIVKIDQSFVRDIQVSIEDQSLVRSVVDMAHSLGRKVVAEGVETLDHGRFLIHCGCDFAQGYGIARPMPGSELAQWLAGWSCPSVWTAQHSSDSKISNPLRKTV